MHFYPPRYSNEDLTGSFCYDFEFNCLVLPTEWGLGRACPSQHKITKTKNLSLFIRIYAIVVEHVRSLLSSTGL